MSPAAERMAPPGMSSDHWRMMFETPFSVRPYCRRADSEISMEISNGLDPIVWANETPGRATISSRMVSISSFMVASSRSPASWTFTTGFCQRNSEIRGRSVSAGKVEMPSTAIFSLSIMSGSSTPSSTSTLTTPMPSDDVEEISRMPSMVSMASSTRSTTPFSTSSGAAPR